MDAKRTKSNPVQQHQPHQIRLPVFIKDESIGLGDLIKHATSAVGIQPCGGCEQRAAFLNRWLVFIGHTTK